jgi:molybdate transport system ATP-binding protein
LKPKFFTVQDLNGKAGKFQLQDISFSLEARQYLVVLGPTGCGKTVLLETLAGLRHPTGGKILLDNIDITHLPPEARRFGFAYQDSLLFPFLNVRDNILFAARSDRQYTDPSVRKRAGDLAEAMGISHLLDRFPRFLSGGEKQRVSLARAFLMKPPLLLLDEPLSSLDPQTRSSIRELLKNLHNKEESGIIHVTHDFNEALQLGTHLIVMDDGRILQEGKTEDVFFQPASITLANFLMGENLLQGRIERREGRFYFKEKHGPILIGPIDGKYLPNQNSAEVTLLIRAGHLSLSPAVDCTGNMNMNSWYGFIERINCLSTHMEVVCRGDGNYRAVLSNNEWRELNLHRGSQVKISVDVDDIHLIPN